MTKANDKVSYAELRDTKVKRAVIEFADGMVVEFTKPLSATELCIWLEHYAKPKWTPPPPNKSLMAEIQKGYTEPKR